MKYFVIYTNAALVLSKGKTYQVARGTNFYLFKLSVKYRDIFKDLLCTNSNISSINCVQMTQIEMNFTIDCITPVHLLLAFFFQ